MEDALEASQLFEMLMGDELNNPRKVERKLATILSADVAQYSRLMAEDEEQTLHTFSAYKQIFESLVASLASVEASPTPASSSGAPP